MAYKDKDIKTLNFPDDVRKRPNMYVGDITNPLFGLFQIVKEVMDNSPMLSVLVVYK